MRGTPRSRHVKVRQNYSEEPGLGWQGAEAGDRMASVPSGGSWAAAPSTSGLVQKAEVRLKFTRV